MTTNSSNQNAVVEELQDTGSPKAITAETRWRSAILLVCASLLAITMYRWNAVDGNPQQTNPVDLARDQHLHQQTSRLKQPRFVVNINSAALGELQLLPGVGERLAAKIHDFVREHGPIKSSEQLLGVPGIGTAKLKELEPYLEFESTVNE